MKFVLRWAFRLFLLLVIVVVIGVLLMDRLLKGALEKQLGRSTGMEVHIESINVGLLHPVLTIEKLKIFNTAEFGGKPFVDLPELHIEYDRHALFAHQFHYKLIRLNLAEVNLVQDKNGRTNLRALMDRQRVSETNDPVASPQKKSADYAFTGIEALDLSLGHATLVKMNNPGQVREFPMNVRHQVLPNIQNGDDLQFRMFMLFGELGGLQMIDFLSDAFSKPASQAGK